MRIGFLGLGKMGAHMARRLVEAGHQVTVWNRTAERQERLSRQRPARRHGQAMW